MKTRKTCSQTTGAKRWACWVALGILTTAAHAQSLLSLAATNLFGGAGDQRATTVSIGGGAVFLSGVSSANGGDGLVVRFAGSMTDNAAPVWSTIWPTMSGGDDFMGVAASGEGVYLAGSSFGRTSDTAGGKENKGITVKFPLNGPVGGGFAGAIWDVQTPAPPGAFSYGGSEGLWGTTLSVEAGSPFVYVTGFSQAHGGNGGRLFVSKVDANGTNIWTRNDSGNMTNSAFSIGRSVAVGNGFIYVAGFSADNGNKTYLRKYDLNGNLVWFRGVTTGQYLGVTVFGGALYAVGQGSSGAGNFLIDKWDEAGNRLWSREYDRNGADEALQSVVGLGSRIFAAGWTRGNTAGGADAAVAEFDPATGDLLAATLFGGAQDDFANGITANGSDIFVAGESRSFTWNGNGSGQNDVLLLRYSVAPVTLTSIVVTPSNPTIAIGGSQQFNATGMFSDGSMRPLTNTSPSTWSNAAAIPQTSYGLGVTFAGGKLYAVSGFSTRRVAVYDPASNTWSTAALIPELRQYAGIATLDEKIYVVGGDTGGSGDRATLLRYDPALNTWTSLTPMPLGPRYGLRAAVLNGKIYAVGGYTLGGGGTYLDRVEIYDPANNTWTTGTPLPAPRINAMMGVIAGKLYVAGGGNTTGALTNGVVLDPASNVWTAIAPPVRSANASAVLNGRLYGIGGEPSNRQMQVYDPVSNTWSTNLPPMPTGRWDYGIAADAAASRIYVVGGWNGSYVSALEVFSPGAPEVVWNSASPNVASITASGLVTGLADGTSAISATVDAVTGSTLLTVTSGGPTITNQPVSQTASLNGTVTFSVGASGGGTLTYQWLHNGTNIVGATNSSLTLPNLSAAEAGAYSVVVTSSGLSATSDPATLGVVDLKMYAGITIAGPVGSSYRVDYNDNLNGTNWMTLTNVTLAAPAVFVLDPDSPQHVNRFYRTVPVP